MGPLPAIAYANKQLFSEVAEFLFVNKLYVEAGEAKRDFTALSAWKKQPMTIQPFVAGIRRLHLGASMKLNITLEAPAANEQEKEEEATAQFAWDDSDSKDEENGSSTSGTELCKLSEYFGNTSRPFWVIEIPHDQNDHHLTISAPFDVHDLYVTEIKDRLSTFHSRR